MGREIKIAIMGINSKAFLVNDLYGELKQAATRNGYGEGLVALGENNKDVVVLSADLTESTRAIYFKERFPERFFACGVAEQNMIGMAAGLALAGKIPFASSFGVFCPNRCLDQIRISVCYNNANVKIGSSHAGVSVGPDGATHQALEDIAVIRALPNMRVVAPCDSLETRKATVVAAEVKGPVYIRFGRPKIPVFTTDKTPFKLGKAEIFRFGKDVAIIACGPMVYQALLAARTLQGEGIDACVVNNHTVKPMDVETVVRVARETHAVVTAEEHQKHGGMGSAVSEILGSEYPVPVEMVGVDDKFGESGSAAELLEKFGLTAEDIVEAAKRAIARK